MLSQFLGTVFSHSLDKVMQPIRTMVSPIRLLPLAATIETDAATKLGACLAGFGIAQVIDLGLDDHFEKGELINLFPDWSGEQYPLYVYYVSRAYVPAKIRKFIDFIKESLGGRPKADGGPKTETIGE